MWLTAELLVRWAVSAFALKVYYVTSASWDHLNVKKYHMQYCYIVHTFSLSYLIWMIAVGGKGIHTHVIVLKGFERVISATSTSSFTPLASGPERAAPKGVWNHSFQLPQVHLWFLQPVPSSWSWSRIDSVPDCQSDLVAKCSLLNPSKTGVQGTCISLLSLRTKRGHVWQPFSSSSQDLMVLKHWIFPLSQRVCIRFPFLPVWQRDVEIDKTAHLGRHPAPLQKLAHKPE